MAERTPTDESSVFNEVQRVIDGLIKFDADSRMRIYRTVGAFFGFDDPTPKTPANAGRQSAPEQNSREPHFSSHEDPSPKDFMFQKQPSTQIERVACLAYYLTHYQGKPHFKTTDISTLNTAAAQAKFSNTSYAIRDATRAGLLASVTEGMKQLSVHGEKYVEALPDRAAAAALMTGRRPRRKSGRSGAGATAGPAKASQ